MNANPTGFNLRFIDIASNSHIRALHASLTKIVPDAVWWITDPVVGRLPFPSGNPLPFCPNGANDETLQKAHAEISKQLQEEIQPNQPLPLRECCEGHLQGIAPFFFREQFVGGIGVCHVPEAQRDTLEEILRLVQGYLNLLSNYIEDNDDLELVHGIWSETISVLDLDLLLERVTEELLRTLDREDCVILMVDEDGDFTIAFMDGLDRTVEETPPVGISRYDYATRLRRLQEGINELEEDDPLADWYRGLLGKKANIPICMVPFVRNDLFVGAFLFSGPKPDLGHGRKRLLDLVAVGAATALDNAGILVRMNQRQLALTTIHTVHRLMTTARSLNELLPRIGQLATQLMKVRKCSLMLVSKDGTRLIPRVKIHLDNGEAGTVEIQRGQGLAGWVADNFNPVIYSPSQDSPPLWEDDGQSYPDACYLSVPLIEEDVTAVLTVSRETGRFSPGDREILMTYAEQALIAIQNTQVHEDQRDSTVRMLRSVANLIESRDPTSDGLTCRISDFAGRLATVMNLPPDEVRDITYAALVANAGVLRRMGFRRRTAITEHSSEDLTFSQTLSAHLKLPPRVGEIVLHLRESWDGRGYPNGFSGDAIPRGSRVLAVAEAYVSLVDPGDDSRYRRPPERALAILKRLSGRAFDPGILKITERMIQHDIH